VLMARRGDPGPYRSALDLPSVVEMLEQIRGAKPLTRLVARKHRAEVLRIEGEVRHIAGLVDSFYALLGDRHWVFHDSMNTEVIESVVQLGADDAELGVIQLYETPDALESMIRALTRFPQLRARMDLIDRAAEDYREGRHYSTVLVLLTVMDGFVNDLEPAQRRGLHAREANEMAGWDTVVGHHLGLSHAHATFVRRFTKTSDEEVHELYRNGIVHGMLTNYDNVVVATKAWNRLFAVSDWAKSLERQALPPAPPRARDLFRQVRALDEAKKALAEWQPRSVEGGTAGIQDEPLFVLTLEFLVAWRSQNYGRMGALLSSMIQESTPGKTAGMVRENWSEHQLMSFSINRLDYTSPAVCEVDAELAMTAQTRSARLRWIREGEDGMAVTPNEEGVWRLVAWGPWAVFQGANRDQEP
jgi:hypothetical protein